MVFWECWSLHNSKSFVKAAPGCAMTQGFLIVSFFVLSWKWYLFAAFLHYFWHRRKRQVTTGASEIDVRHTGHNVCQLGITLGAFDTSSEREP